MLFLPCDHSILEHLSPLSLNTTVASATWTRNLRATISHHVLMTGGFLYGAGAETLIFVTGTSGK